MYESLYGLELEVWTVSGDSSTCHSDYLMSNKLTGFMDDPPFHSFNTVVTHTMPHKNKIAVSVHDISTLASRFSSCHDSLKFSPSHLSAMMLDFLASPPSFK